MEIDMSGYGIVKPIIQGLIKFISQVISYVWSIAIDYITTTFQPDLNTFTEKFLDGSLEQLCKIFKNIGVTLAIFIFVFQLIVCLFGKITEVKNTPVKLTIRFMIAILLVNFGMALPKQAVLITNEFWATMTENFSNMDGSDTSTDSIKNLAFETLQGSISTDDLSTDQQNLINKITGGDRTNSSKGNLAAELQNAGKKVLETITQAAGVGAEDLYFSTIFPIIYIIMLVCILINVFRLILEVIERYVIVNLLVRVFPTVAAFFTSVTTSNILVSYTKMFIGQLFLLIMSLFFSEGFVFLCSAKGENNPFTTFMGLCFILAYLRSAIKMDSYMNSMGINVAQTGGGLLDTVFSDFRGLSSMGRVLGGMKSNAGSVIQAGASLAGSSGAYKLGSSLQGTAAKQSTTDFIGRQGSNLGHGDAMKAVMSNNPQNATMLNSSTTPEYKQAMLNQMASTSNGIPNYEQAFAHTAGGSKAQLVPNSIDVQQGKINGQISLSNGKIAEFELSKNRSDHDLMAISTPEGDMYLSSNSGNLLTNGESVDYIPNRNGVSEAEMAMGTSFANLGFNDEEVNQIGNVAGTTGGGIDINDKDNETIAHIPARGRLDDATYGFKEPLSTTDFEENGIFKNAISVPSGGYIDISEYNRESKTQHLTVYGENNKQSHSYTVKEAFNDQERGMKFTDKDRKLSVKIIEDRNQARRN